MKTIRSLCRVLLLSLAVGALPLHAGQFTAFSLNAAEAALREGGAKAAEARRLGAISHLSGMVYDASGQHDVIIVGESVPGYPAISLDDFVVALRGVYRHTTPPLVSIDPTSQTPATHTLKVRFEGGIERTAFGRDALACDVLLKQVALGKVPVEVWGVRSYRELLSMDAQRSGQASQVGSRFWFRSLKPVVTCHDDTYSVLELPVAVKTEVLKASIGGVAVTNLSGFHDSVGDTFAHQMELNLENLAVEFPVLKRARQLLALVSLAEGVKLLEDRPNLDYWLDRYAVEDVPTPTSFDLIESTGRVPAGEFRVNISGGLDLAPYVVRLKKGHPSAYKELVLKSRPSPSTLVWHPPLQGWEVPGVAPEEPAMAPRSSDAPGFALDANVFKGTLTPFSAWNNLVDPLPKSMTAAFSPTFHNFDAAPPAFAHIGGVALIGRVDTTNNVTSASLDNGGFALVADGEEARLSPQEFSKFVTALWSVNYCDTDPGISIDPIAPDVKEHLVRYIGNVINSDLGRVMRVCDYTMKQWAVGSSRPDIAGFMNPDDIAGRRGVAFTGVGSRFWFVPKDLTFRRSDGMLIFDHGRMTVQTEFLFNNNRGMKADPANEQWADWFTGHYGEIAAKYPVFSELYDYAKLVALAKYLKESGTPLLWFLIANKDMVLTEDSPGTVEALVKRSDHFEGLRIEGGVQLVAPPQYVFDDKALNAIHEAQGRHTDNVSTSLGEPHVTGELPSAVQSGGNTFALVPQHSLTCGQDSRGTRYQTDLATREGNRPGLELVRWFAGADDQDGDFGRGWRLLIPYRISPEGNDRTNFLTLSVPSKMRLQHILTGKTEILVFDTNRYSVAGWLPEKLAASDVLGIFPLTDGTFQLEDKLGNHFVFDQGGHLTGMALGTTYRMQIEYSTDPADVLEPRALQIRAGTEQVQVANALAPRALTLANRITGQRETYLFSDTNEIAGYVSANPGNASGFIAILSNGALSFRDQTGNRFDFDRTGNLESIRLMAGDPLIRAVTCGKQRADFRYAISATGHAYVSKVSLRGAEAAVEVRYHQDESGRLYSVQSSLEKKNDGDHADARKTIGHL